MRRLGLADARDVVVFALDRQQADVGDPLRAHLAAAMLELALGQQVALEHHVDRLEIELLGQVQHRQVLVVEFQVLVGLVAVALHQVGEVLTVRLLVLLQVHRHEAGQLDEARIDAPPRAQIGRRHVVDHVRLEPGERPILGQLVGHGRRQARVDRRAHEGHRGRTALLAVVGHQRGGGQDGRPGLANRHHMRARAHLAQHLADVVDIVVEVEAPLQEGHVAGVGPLGDEHLVVLQEGLDRAAQQRRIVARQRRRDQDRRLQLGLPGAAQVAHVAGEVGQLAPGRRPDLLGAHPHVAAVDLDLVELPVGLAVAPRQVREEVAGRVDAPAHVAFGRRIQRRTPEVARSERGPPHRRGGVIAGFIEGIEHTGVPFVRRNIAC